MYRLYSILRPRVGVHSVRDRLPIPWRVATLYPLNRDRDKHHAGLFPYLGLQLFASKFVGYRHRVSSGRTVEVSHELSLRHFLFIVNTLHWPYGEHNRTCSTRLRR